MDNLNLDCALSYLNEGKVLNPIELLSEQIDYEINQFNTMIESYNIINEKVDIKKMVENVKEKIKELWTKFKNWLKKVKDFITKKIRSIFSKDKIVVGKAKSNLAKAKKVDESKRSVKESSFIIEADDNENLYLDGRITYYAWVQKKDNCGCRYIISVASAGDLGNSTFDESVGGYCSAINKVSSFLSIARSEDENHLKAAFIDLVSGDNSEISKYWEPIKSTCSKTADYLHINDSYYDYMSNIIELIEKYNNDIEYLEDLIDDVDRSVNMYEHKTLIARENEINESLIPYFAKVASAEIDALRKLADKCQNLLGHILPYKEKAVNELNKCNMVVDRIAAELLNS